MLVTIVDTPHRLVLKCDWCGSTFERPYSTGRTKGSHHYCTRKCQGLGTREKRELTSQQRYGETVAMKTQTTKNKLRSTFQGRYGVNAASQVPGAEERKRQTCMQRYGVPYVMQHAGVNEKRERTCRDRYGHSTALNTVTAREKNQSPECQRKKHETMRQNGTYGSSLPEERCFLLLCELYGADNVERQVTINKWPIDFYVKSIDVYVQLDGVYWHGLDRSIEVIAEHRTKRDAQIHRKWLIDREQNQWFAERGMKLVRIRDIDLPTVRQ